MCSHQHSTNMTPHEYPVSNLGAGEKWIKSLTRNRLGTFLGGHFADVNLSSVLFTHKLDSDEHVKLQVWSAPGRSKPGFEEAMKQEFKHAKKGDRFGPSCECSYSQRCLRQELMRFFCRG
jgi:alpha-mannosidase